MNRRKFSKEFKVEACKMVVVQGQSTTQTAKNLGINEGVLWRWVRQYREKSGEAFPGEGCRSPADKRIQELEAEVRRLRMEREILKKAMAYFVEPPR